ncbi:MAG: hypothetical protein M3Z64_05465, partial [Verrucomicrobiota bacterium]|nr:hypothetical protein [Verrucomicrobiota bacterium]
MNPPLATHFRLSILLAICGTSSISICPAAETPGPDSLQQQILAHARTVGPDDYTFTRTSRVEQTAVGKTEQRVIVDRWDPTKPTEQRWSLVSIDGRPAKADELKAYTGQNAKRSVPNYSRVAKLFAAAATSGRDASGRTVYHFATLPNETIMALGTDLSPSGTGDATVRPGPVPFVEQFRFTLFKPARVKLIAKIEKFEAITRYRLMPDGKPVPAEQVS